MFVFDLFEKEVGEQTMHGFNKPGHAAPNIQNFDPNESGDFYVLPHVPSRFRKKVEFLARFHHVPLNYNEKTDTWFSEKHNKAFVRDVEYVLSVAGYGAAGLTEGPMDQFNKGVMHREHYEVIDPSKDEDDRSRRHFATNDESSAERIARKLGLAVIKVTSPKKSFSSNLFAFEASIPKLPASELKTNPGVNLNELIGRYVWVMVPEHPHIAKSAKVLRIGDSGLVTVKLKTPVGNDKLVPDFFKGEQKISVRPSEIYVDIPPIDFKKKIKPKQEEMI
jgi:hypothetical protein